MIFNGKNSRRKLDELKNINTRVFLMCCPGLYLILSGGFLLHRPGYIMISAGKKYFLA
jgi:hypothetical protein